MNKNFLVFCNKSRDNIFRVKFLKRMLNKARHAYDLKYVFVVADGKCQSFWDPVALYPQWN